MITIETATVRSPVGKIELYARDGALVGLVFDDRNGRLAEHLQARFGEIDYQRTKDPAGAASRLRRYLDGELDALDDIAVDLGGTPFQARVWAALRKIPVGATWSYAQLARKVGSPDAVRAVGAANGRNPVSLVVPCHRVIASDGTLCGYGGGLPRKQWLLAHERALLV
ncbi:MAG TPA: methylated-DNA--[protein]-cysteine S-methyltransferase [Polyangia bacterium]|jgi:methylated-DNA-[protein]-cysteine S-methyltransferase